MGNEESKSYNLNHEDLTSLQSKDEGLTSLQPQNEGSASLQAHKEGSMLQQGQNEGSMLQQAQNEGSMYLQSQKEGSMFLQSQKEGPMSLKFQNSVYPPTNLQNIKLRHLQSQNLDFISFSLQNRDSISLELQNKDLESSKSENKNSRSDQLHPVIIKRQEEVDSLSTDACSYGQYIKTANSLTSQFEAMPTTTGKSFISLGNIASLENKVRNKYLLNHEQVNLDRSRHSNEILPHAKGVTSDRCEFNAIKPIIHPTTEKEESGNAYGNNVSKDLIKVKMLNNEQDELCQKLFFKPLSIQSDKATSLDTRHGNHRSWKDSTQQSSVRDDVKYICEIHKATTKSAMVNNSNREKKSRTNVDPKLQWTCEPESKVGICQADMLGKRINVNRTNEMKLNNYAVVQKVNSQIFKDFRFSSTADLRRPPSLLSGAVVSRDQLSMSFSTGERMYSAKRKYILKSIKDKKYSLRLLYLGSDNDAFLQFEKFYHKSLPCQFLLQDINGTFQYGDRLTRGLIRDLVNFNNFQTDLATLSNRQGKGPNEIMPWLQANEGIFSVINLSPTVAVVRLRPKIRFCSDRVTSKCQSTFCFAIHVCPYYIYDACRVNGCKFGHALRTIKSNYIFKSFYLDYFSEFVLKAILRKIWAGMIYPKLCLDYNAATCSAANCRDLHLCYRHVMSLGLCPGLHTYCTNNHDIYDPCCQKVLKYFNISIKETRRDLMKYLRYTMKSIIAAPYYAEAVFKDKSDYKVKEYFETLV